MIYREPRNLIVQVEDGLMGQVLYYWTYYNKPTKLLILRANTEGLTAIKLSMNNADAGSFVFILADRLHVRLYDADTKQPVQVQHLLHKPHKVIPKMLLTQQPMV